MFGFDASAIPLSIFDIRPSKCRTLRHKNSRVTLQPISMLPPSALVFSAHASHIMPGPLRG